jgi:hypothetical protein
MGRMTDAKILERKPHLETIDKRTVRLGPTRAKTVENGRILVSDHFSDSSINKGRESDEGYSGG